MVSLKAYRISHILLMIAICTSAVIAITLAYRYTKTVHTLTVIEKQRIQHTIENATQRINSFVTSLTPLVNSVAEQLNGPLTKNKIKEVLLKKPAQITDLGVVLTPEANGGHRFALAYIEHDDIQKMIDFTKKIDYTSSSPHNHWYRQTVAQAKPTIEFSLDPFSQTPAFIAAAPLYDQRTTETKKSVRGVIFATQSIAHIAHLLTTVYTDQTGYWLLTDLTGRILVHPNNTLVTQQANVETLAQQQNNNALSKALAEAQNNKTGILLSYDQLLKSASYISYKPVENLPLLLFYVSTAQDPFAHNNFVRQHLLHLILSILALFVFISLLSALKTHESQHNLWIVCIFFTLSLTGILGALWNVAAHYPHRSTHSITINSKRELYQVIEQLKKKSIAPINESGLITEQEVFSALHYRYKQGRYVPTGIFINDLNFVDQDRIEFVGIIWQRYFDGIHTDVSRGFIFPQLAGKQTVTEISRTKRGKQETIAWLISCTLNQKMSYQAYPFDTKNITIQIAHKDFDKNITLVPDLDAYSILAPQTLPGISRYTNLAGWYLIGSYFGYTLVNYLTNFGVYNYGPFGVTDQMDKTFAPELHFTVVAQRFLLETLTTDLIMLLVIAFLLFIILLTYQAQGVGNTFAMITAILFSTILAQLHFKSKIPSHELVYFEVLYFIMYGAILAVSIVTLLHMYRPHTSLIRYKNNLISKLLYWPLIMASVLLISITYLY